MAKVERRSGSEVLRDKRARAVAEVGADGNANTKALLSVLFGAAFIAAFNENIINVGLMDIMAEFSIDSITAQWLVTGYMMVTAIVTAVVAFLLRRFTLRQVFFAGGVILAAGSAVDIVAPNLAILLVARLFQAIGTGIFIPTMMSPSQTAGLKQLPRELNAHGVALINVFIQVAASAGPSLYMGILSSSEATSLASGASAAASVADGFAASALVATIIGAIGLVTSLVYARVVANAAPHADAAHAQAPRGLDLASVMKRDVFTIRADQTVAEAVQAMLDHHTSGLPVVDKSGHVVAFISDGDIMKSLADAGQPVIDLTYSLSVFADDVRFDMRLAHLMNANVMEVATDRVVSVDVGTPIERVCTVLGEKRIKKLPVLDGGRLVGTISRSDVNRSLMSAFLQAA